MYLDHWELERPPFSPVLDPNRFFAGPTQDEALARIDHLVATHRRLGLVLGDSGVGKSYVLRVAAKNLARNGCRVVSVDVLGVGVREFFGDVASGMGAAPQDGDDVLRVWRRIADRVYENRLHNVDTVLLVDDAGQARPDVLPQIARLVRIDPSPDSRWTIVLAAVPKQIAGWKEVLLPMVDLRIDLAPWEEGDTVGFVQTALIDAGCAAPVFDDDALRALHALAGGVPRQVTRLAEAALVVGAAAEAHHIDTETVHAASEEIGWPPAAVV